MNNTGEKTPIVLGSISNALDFPSGRNHIDSNCHWFNFHDVSSVGKSSLRGDGTRL